MNRKRVMTWAVVVLLAALLTWKLHTSHFDWASFWRAWREVHWPMLVLAILFIYANTIPRAIRWNIFLKPSVPHAERKHWWTLVGPQYIGFAGLAAFGRVGELIRPYLVSRRMGLSFSSQIAVVAVERIFDLAAFGLLFAGNLMLSNQLSALPYHERFREFGFVIGAMIAVLIVFVVAVRVAGEPVARFIGRLFGLVSASAAETIREKILEFREGLNTISSVGDFVAISFWSLALWSSIAVAYAITMHAFPAPVNQLSISHCLLLMGFSVVGGVVNLPGIGGGAQAMLIGALTKLFGVPTELAASAAILTYFVTTLSSILPGLLFAQVESVNLRSVAREARAENV